MIKRANKITSLFLAAAAVISLVPAGVNAADIKRIESKDGIIYNAVAYKDGKFVIDGEIKDNEGAYYLSNGKYTELDDIDSGSDYTTYGSKYAMVDDGDYFVDLTNGKVTDDDLAEDDEDDAASALRKKIKDSDRYADAGDSNYAGDKDIAKLELLPGNKFGDTWYSAKYKADSTTSGASVRGFYDIYTDSKGSYIDADYNLGKLKVANTTGSGAKTVTIENTKDKYVLDNAGVKDTFAEITSSKVLGQDSNYIYRFVTLKITGNVKVVNGKEIADPTAVPVIQKISKAQASDDIDDAKYAKTVTNYIIGEDDGTVANAAGTSDVDKFIKLLQDNDSKVTISSGKVIVYNVTDGTGDNVIVQTTTLKSKNGYYYTDVEGQCKVEAEYSSDINKTAFDVDADGNIWIIESGYVKKFDNTDDFDKVYKVDGSMDAISVYDKNNMVVWNQDDEVYSIIGSKDSDEDKDDENKTTGWVQTSTGAWTFYNTDGTQVKHDWVYSGGKYYYINRDGIMETGTKWVNPFGNWYLLNTDGSMSHSGWVCPFGNWYYLNSNGNIMTGWQYINGSWYYMNSEGTMQTGWQYVNGSWYYLQSNGAMKTGWLNDNGTWYFLNSSGAMLSNTTVNGYKLGSNGAWIR